MSKLANIARPYAKAAFLHAQEQKTLDSWSLLLAQWAEISQDSLGKAYLKNPTVVVEQKIAFLKQWMVTEIAKSAENFLELLAAGRRLALLSEISVQFERLKRVAFNELLVVVTSSKTLSNEAKQEIKKALAKRFGKTILLKEAVEPTLLGGILVMADDLFIDGSIKGKLNHLADAMKVRVG